MSNYKVWHPTGEIQGELLVSGSKSIHQRLLVIQHLYQNNLSIANPSTSNDAAVLQNCLESINASIGKGGDLNIQDGGTAARFLMPVLALSPGTWTLDGTTRMRERPMGELFEALRSEGTEITCLEKEGHLPVKAEGQKLEVSSKKHVKIDASQSSQFASAMILTAPSFSRETTIEFTGEVSSKPYLEMTIALMREFGFFIRWIDNNNLQISGEAHGEIQKYAVEPDWSSLAFHYSIAALAKKSDLKLGNASLKSAQGDKVIHDWYQLFNVVQSEQENQGMRIQSASPIGIPHFDFTGHPDLAPAVLVTLSALRIPFTFEGVENLKYKESDRLSAIAKELAKFGVSWVKESGLYVCQATFKWPDEPVRIGTYKDHRIAMAFAPLGIIKPVVIEDIEVVKKSYPEFWQDLRKIKFVLEAVD